MLNSINNRMHKKNRVISQINVTPFVDVMLVLLIVFMITAPLLTVGVSVDLPKTKASQLNSKGDPIIISIKKNGELYIQEREIDTLQLLPRLKAISSGNKNLRIYVCLLYTSPSPRDRSLSRMPSSA